MPLLVEDKIAIQELMARYIRAVDVDCTEEQFFDLFTVDAVMSSPVTGDNVGREGLRSFRNAFLERRGKLQLRHMITNQIIEGEGDLARLEAYFLIVQTRVDVPVDERKTEIRFCGTYECELRRQAGVWKIHRRHVEIDSRS
jgi:hypothetical protein